MKGNNLFSCAFCVGCLWASSLSAAEVLDLRRAEALALAQNAELQASAYLYHAAAATARGARGIYDLRSGADFSLGEARDAVNSRPETTVESRYALLDLSLTQLVSTGANLSLALENRRDDDLLGGGSRQYDPSWRSELRLGLTQPLLKGFGPTVTEESIHLAVHNRAATAASVQLKAVTVLTSVRDLYGQTLQARQMVAYREASVALAQQLLDESRAKVAVGVLPPLDALDAEVGLKQRERDLLDARQAYRELLDRLAVQLASVDEFDVAAEAAPQPRFSPDAEIDLATALAQRPELVQAREEVARQELLVATSRNRTLPALDLAGSYGRKALEGDLADGVDEAVADGLDNWQVGLTFSYPLGNRQAKGEAWRRRYEFEASRRTLRQRELEVRREVRSATLKLEVGLQRLEVSAKGREFAEERLKNLLKRREVGLATTLDVLDGEAVLAQSQAESAADEANYAAAVTDYLRATGRLLEHEGVVVDTDAPPERTFTLPSGS
jgi:outer membrane protein TolC